jgi:tripartite-type tricarboxylate transporter receptor subunit TctC
VLVVQPAIANSVKELIAAAKAKPGALNYASSGIGSAPHLATELFRSMAGINIVHVPYKGAGPSVVAMLAGEVQLRIGSLSPMLPHMKSGKLRALGVTSLKSTALVPDLPPISVAVPGYEAVGVTGLMAPAKIPAAIANRLS